MINLALQKRQVKFVFAACDQSFCLKHAPLKLKANLQTQLQRALCIPDCSAAQQKTLTGQQGISLF